MYFEKLINVSESIQFKMPIFIDHYNSKDYYLK